MMWQDLFFLALGIVFGMSIMANRQTHKEQLTVEQVDAKLREELQVNKNLVSSLKQDLDSAKTKLRYLQGKNNGNS